LPPGLGLARFPRPQGGSAETGPRRERRTAEAPALSVEPQPLAEWGGGGGFVHVEPVLDRVAQLRSTERCLRDRFVEPAASDPVPRPYDCSRDFTCLREFDEKALSQWELVRCLDQQAGRRQVVN